MKIKICALLLICGIFACGAFGCNASSEGTTDDGEDSAATYTVTELTVARDELSIYGKLYTPNNADGTMPAVILSHSALLTCDSMQSYAAEFAKRGFVAFAFDFCGGSSSGKSTDIDMTIFTEVLDLKAVLNAVSQLENVDSSQIYLFGTSQGGLISALTANDCADQIAKMILLYPAFNIPDSVQNVTYNFFYELFGYGEQFIETLQGYDAYEHIARFTKPVLIVHGTSDTTVDISYSQRAAEIYADCTLKQIDGANHGFNSENTFGFGEDYDEEAWEYIDEFLNL